MNLVNKGEEIEQMGMGGVVVCGPFEYGGFLGRWTILRSCAHGRTLLILPLLSCLTVPS